MSISHTQNFFFFQKWPIFSFQFTIAPVGANSEKLSLYKFSIHGLGGINLLPYITNKFYKPWLGEFDLLLYDKFY